MREVSCVGYPFPIVSASWPLVFRSFATFSQRLKTALSLVYNNNNNNNNNPSARQPHRACLQPRGVRLLPRERSSKSARDGDQTLPWCYSVTRVVALCRTLPLGAFVPVLAILWLLQKSFLTSGLNNRRQIVVLHLT